MAQDEPGSTLNVDGPFVLLTMTEEEGEWVTQLAYGNGVPDMTAVLEVAVRLIEDTVARFPDEYRKWSSEYNAEALIMRLGGE